MAIVVPIGQRPAQRLPMPDPQWSMMAAAMMHENGRLIQREDPKLEQQANANAKSTQPAEPKP